MPLAGRGGWGDSAFIASGRCNASFETVGTAIMRVGRNSRSVGRKIKSGHYSPYDRLPIQDAEVRVKHEAFVGIVIQSAPTRRLIVLHIARDSPELLNGCPVLQMTLMVIPTFTVGLGRTERRRVNDDLPSEEPEDSDMGFLWLPHFNSECSRGRVRQLVSLTSRAHARSQSSGSP